MKQPRNKIAAIAFILALSANSLLAQFPGGDEFDLNENGVGIVTPIGGTAISEVPSEMATDPTGGITTSPVLIYDLLKPVVAGDVEIMSPDGTSVLDLLRFVDFPPGGGSSGYVIFYSQPDGDALADVGIPATINANYIQITATGLGAGFSAANNQIGTVGGELTEYGIDTSVVPEPSSASLLAVGGGIWLMRQ